MKKVIFIIICCLVAFSCKKECHTNTTPKNILAGKIKTLTEYDNATDSVNQLIRYYFYYDSINGNLDSIQIEAKISGMYFYRDKYISIKKTGNNVFLFTYKKFLSNEVYYKVYFQNKQITSIAEFDTLLNSETPVTNIHLSNNNADSILDIGEFPLTNLEYYDFDFQDQNCIKTFASWEDYLTGTPIFRNAEYKFAFTSSVNTNMLKYQTPSNLLVREFVIYALSIDGYYVIKPNKNLIDSITTYQSDDTIIKKYNYEFSNNNVSKVKFTDYRTDTPGTFYYRYNDMTYY